MSEMKELNRKGWINVFFVETFFKHYADFSGKVGRKQFWLACFWYLFVGGVAWSLMHLPCLSDDFFFKVRNVDHTIGYFKIIPLIYFLATAIPMMALWKRRLNDIGKKKGWMLAIIAPVLFPIFLLLAFFPSMGAALGSVVGVLAILLIPSLVVLIIVGCRKGSEECPQVRIHLLDGLIILACVVFSFVIGGRSTNCFKQASLTSHRWMSEDNTQDGWKLVNTIFLIPKSNPIFIQLEDNRAAIVCIATKTVTGPDGEKYSISVLKDMSKGVWHVSGDKLILDNNQNEKVVTSCTRTLDEKEVPVESVISGAELQKLKKQACDKFINMKPHQEFDIVEVSSDKMVLKMGDKVLDYTVEF